MTSHPDVISKKARWAGYILSALPALLMLFSAGTKLMKPPFVVQSFIQMGLPESLILKLGMVELACTILYLIPCTSILGAILLTGYLGGATEASLRAGRPFLMPVIVGVLLWGGLFMRDQRVRDLIPLKR